MSSASSPGNPYARNEKVLFWASFLTLIAAGIGFSVRGFILKDWGNQFGFTQSELGAITGGGLVGFGIAIIFFSFCADRFGYGKLMLVAFLLHASSAVVTFAAAPVYATYGKEGAYWCLYVGMWLFALGNGTCEAVINPLTATLFPNNKTHWLNILHAGWPLGLILGALIVLGFAKYEQSTAAKIAWEIKLGVFLVPVLLYGLMIFNRPFPRSEAASAGVPLSESMRTIGLLGAAVAVGLFGVLLNNELPGLLAKVGVAAPPWIGWPIALAMWLGYGAFTGFAPGSLVIAFLYLLHALVGYVELGTDSWIGNITNSVLGDETNATLAFMWTNALMFTLRFFAGPIVHRINPIGLLFASALLGAAGLWLLGQGFTNTVWPWMAAVSVYALGKTFYWPTLLGVISERFPKGGALALGLSGGIGMMAAGLFGAPGIGYKQDYFAAEVKLKESAPDTYARYVARGDDGALARKGYPLVTEFAPEQLPKIAGLDNAKLKVFDDWGGVTDANGKRIEGKTTTLEQELATLDRLEKEGKPVEPKLKENLNKLKTWWDEQGEPNSKQDKPPLAEARLYGPKQALVYTALVPAVLAVGFLLLILYFAATGGYKQVHLEAYRPHPPAGGAPAEDWGR